MRIFPVILLSVLLAGCAAFDRSPDLAGGAELYGDHPLAGKIWSPADNRFVTAIDNAKALREADFVLIGEKHDNPDHYLIQAWLLRKMIHSGRQPAVAFEMLKLHTQEKLDDYLAEHPGDAEGLGAAVGWSESGWPDWAIYQPIAEAALASGAPILAAGPERETTRVVARNGIEAMGVERASALRLDDPPPESVRADMRVLIGDSHCGMLPETMLDPMVNVTLVKDAVMADALIRGATRADRDSAVLIAGTGHTRADFAVPWHLERLAPGAEIVAVGIIEVVAGSNSPGDYAEAYGGALPFDFVWFTPRVDDLDPCEVFREQLRRAGEGKKSAPSNSE